LPSTPKISEDQLEAAQNQEFETIEFRVPVLIGSQNLPSLDIDASASVTFEKIQGVSFCRITKFYMSGPKNCWRETLIPVDCIKSIKRKMYSETYVPPVVANPVVEGQPVQDASGAGVPDVKNDGAPRSGLGRPQAPPAKRPTPVVPADPAQAGQPSVQDELSKRAVRS
jgi:hypothetical protein